MSHYYDHLCISWSKQASRQEEKEDNDDDEDDDKEEKGVNYHLEHKSNKIIKKLVWMCLN